jgi:translation elongation factor EF-Tu-like GTPase
MNRRLSIAALVVFTCASINTLGADSHPRVFTYLADKETAVSITLLNREGSVGRGTPVMNNYRPQFIFSAERSEAICSVKFSPPNEMLQPGETLDATIRCQSDFRVIAGRPAFTALEGGRKVIEGELRQLPQ